MDRRTFVCVVGGGLIAAPLAVHAQQSRRMPRIGVLSPFRSGTQTEDLTRGLQEYGYVDGRNVVIDWRWSDGRHERLPELAAELVRLKVDVIIAFGSEATQAARTATSTIPIVFGGPAYPVETGFVQSLARPGGNLTGITNELSDLAGKYLQLIREVLPEASELAVIWSPNNPGTALFLRDAERAAAQLRFKTQAVALTDGTDLDRAFAAMERARPHAMVVQPIAITFEYDTRISEFAIKNRIVTITGAKKLAERGLLMSYGLSWVEGGRQLASYVDRIVKGAKPADLPVEQPTKFELVINLKTAKALGLTLPQPLLLRADEVIQ
jgi:putative ABC transport system substrate-binding protein